MDIRLEPGTVVVFDLDDTLYFERDYVRSGFQALRVLVESLYAVDVGSSFWEAFAAGDKDAIGTVCTRFGLPVTLKAELLQAYRCHVPTISLRDGAQALLDDLAARQVPLALITDGRSITQHLKINALGLRPRFASISVSADIGQDKPHPLAFERVMQKLPAEHYIYFGDNAAKDFLAPRRLGWKTVGVRAAAELVHKAEVASEYLPDAWVDDLTAIRFTG